MNAADRAQLIAAAKKVAVPAASCVAAGICPEHLLAGKSPEFISALLVVALEAVDHAKLNLLVRLPGDEGLSAEMLRDLAGKRTEAVIAQLRDSGRLVAAAGEEQAVLRHEHETDLYPVIAVLAEALLDVPQVAARRCKPEPQQKETAA